MIISPHNRMIAMTSPGGELSCPGISIFFNGTFSQSGGTNTVSPGDLSTSAGGCGLSGGLLLSRQM